MKRNYQTVPLEDDEKRFSNSYSQASLFEGILQVPLPSFLRVSVCHSSGRLLDLKGDSAVHIQLKYPIGIDVVENERGQSPKVLWGHGFHEGRFP